MSLLEALLGKENPAAQWAARNQNYLGALGAGIGSGQNIQSGLSNGLQMVPQAKQMDVEFRRQQEADAKVLAQTNATQAWLQQNHPDLAQMVEAGMPIGEAWNQATERMKPKGGGEPFTLSPGQVRYGPNGEVVASAGPEPQDPKELFGFEKDLSSQYLGTDPVKTYQVVRNGYEKVRASATSDSGPGDMSMIFAYMKMLDPTSVVREGEFATAENAGGVGQTVSNLYNKVLTGERLTPELRKQFLAAAEQLYAEASKNVGDINSQYSSRATQWGVDPSRFIIAPEVYGPVGGGGDIDSLVNKYLGQ